jgi:hypothetical protein
MVFCSTSRNRIATPMAAFAALSFAAFGVASASLTLQVYPGAARMPTPANVALRKTCGHTIHVVSYDVRADGNAVAAWYAARIPAAVVAETTQEDGLGDRRSIEVFTHDGSQAAVVTQTHFGGSKLTAVARTIGLDTTHIKLETFDPPLGAAYVDLVMQAARGDAAAKHDARARLYAICSDP